jgi:hypothetical protein
MRWKIGRMSRVNETGLGAGSWPDRTNRSNSRSYSGSALAIGSGSSRNRRIRQVRQSPAMTSVAGPSAGQRGCSLGRSRWCRCRCARSPCSRGHSQSPTHPCRVRRGHDGSRLALWDPSHAPRSACPGRGPAGPPLSTAVPHGSRRLRDKHEGMGERGNPATIPRRLQDRAPSLVLETLTQLVEKSDHRDLKECSYTRSNCPRWCTNRLKQCCQKATYARETPL